MNRLFEISMKKYFELRSFQVKTWRESPLSTQNALLMKNIQRAKDTEIGKTYGFLDIESYQEFQKKVPLMTYELIFPYIQKMLDGETNILWPGLVTMFAQSSGTTNDTSKYIPVTRESLDENHYKGGKDLYTLFFLNHPESNLFLNLGSVFSLGGSMRNLGDKINVGDISALLMSQLPFWAQKYREPSLDVALMKEWKDKIPAMIDDTINKNITHISGVPTWFVSLFDEIKKKYPEKTIQDVWPNLELFIHGAVSFKPYEGIFKEILPFQNMKYMEVYNASEGFFAVQDDLSIKGEMLLLTDHGIFYEFIPMNVYATPEQFAVSLADVELGKNYALVISTNAGLWRYDIGDTVVFTSLKPYRIRITGRTKQFINVFGEELMVGNTNQAISEVSTIHNCAVLHYSAAPIFMNEQGKGGHQWVVEFKKEPADLLGFKSDLDKCLQRVNSDYAAKRQNNIALQELELEKVPEGTFMRWLEQRGKLGGQHKVPRLSNERKYIEEILHCVNKN